MKTFKPGIISASALIAAPLVILASCGGSFKPALEGAFTGWLSNGTLVTAIVLGDGTFWSTSEIASGNIQSFSKGKVDSRDGNFTMAFTDYLRPGDNPVPGTGNGAYTYSSSSSSAAGSLTEAGQTLTFKVTSMSAKNYVYKTPASVASIVGNWSGELLNGDDASVVFFGNGILSGSALNGCQFNGKFSSAGVNVFNVSVSFGGEPCASPGETASGIGVSILRDDGRNQLTVALVNAAQTVGFLFQARR